MGEGCCKWLRELVGDETKEQQIEERKSEAVRFFMIGSGGAGKTTVIRQLKCLCKDSPKDYKAYNPSWHLIEKTDIFSQIEYDLFKKRIRQNILSSINNLCQQSELWGYPMNHELVEEVKMLQAEFDLSVIDGGYVEQQYTDTIVDDLVTLINNESINKTLKRSHQMLPQYRIEDGTRHFLNENDIRRIFADNTVLTSLDIVHSRYPTTGIQDFRFGIKGMKIQIHDMGGQVTELVKLPQFISQWFMNTHDNNFVLFVASMADFNLVDESNPEFTVMDRSIKTLSIILDMPIVKECSLLIFLNKTDRFNEVVRNLLVTPEGRAEILKYLGSGLDSKKKAKVENGTIEVEDLHKAIDRRFQEEAVKSKRKTGVYTKFTKAVDPKMMSAIFGAIECEIVANIAKTIFT
ncbi:unnamed protein product [Auanema sp. JU1783]|nr:unnamed protein product [Auanema sp. JU1783]